tara:strand:- start:557 stop:745 length:189 start_codon:yes stop_codon:yes gene_type:complete
MSDEIKSPIDSILVDMIIEHFNQQSIKGEDETLSGNEFMKYCREAESNLYQNIIIKEEGALA